MFPFYLHSSPVYSGLLCITGLYKMILSFQRTSAPISGVLISGSVLLSLLFSAVQVFAEYNPIDKPDARLSQDADGATGGAALVTADSGDVVVFASSASNYVTADTNGVGDIFAYTRSSGAIDRLSRNNSGVEGDGSSSHPGVSADGRYVVFESAATNLVSGDTNAAMDVFLYDRDDDTIARISLTSAALQSNGDSFSPAISDDGEIIAFASDATNLVSGDTNAATDIFIYVRASGAVTRISLTTAGVQGNGTSGSPALSSDGQYVAFASSATNLVSGDTNGVTDIFLRDRDADTTVRISLSSTGAGADGASANPSISDDGSIIAFESAAANITAGDTNSSLDVFTRNTATSTNELISLGSGDVQGDGDSRYPVVSGTGRYIGYQSEATNLVTGDTNSATDIFIRDRTDSVTVRASVKTRGQQIEAAATLPDLNGNAHYVSFLCKESAVTAGKTGAEFEVFVLNTQCVLEPDGVTPLDTDGDSSDDCSDGCPTDAAKTAAGICGCGVADTDTDGDGTPDCNDQCPADAAKIEHGSCGCGVADDDTTGTGLPDCLDPSSETKPRQARARDLGGRRLRIIIPKNFKGVVYQVTIKAGGRTIRTYRSRRRRTTVSLPSGRYKIRYRIRLPGGGLSKRSSDRRISVR